MFIYGNNCIFFKKNVDNVIFFCQLNSRFQLIEWDVILPIYVQQIDQIYHLACPASPVHYQVQSVDFF